MGSDLIVSASGIRGIAGESLTPEVTRRYGSAFARRLRDSAGATGPAGRRRGGWLRKRRTGGPRSVVTARDGRVSGPELHEAACQGLTEQGFDVLDMGIAPTPTALLAIGRDPTVVGGILVTASHNPAEWNGLKLVSSEGRFLTRAESLEVQRLFETPAKPPRGPWSGLRGSVAPFFGGTDFHINSILNLPVVRRPTIASRGLRVVLDCVHGAGGVIMPQLLERLGCMVKVIGGEPDGRFPRAPEPLPDNLGDLCTWVEATGADIGMAVDPDVDRLALVDETGRPVGEDWTLALAVELTAAGHEGPVVTNLSSSNCIEDAARRAGADLYRSPVGEANVVDEMIARRAAIGGEGNGGVIYQPLQLTRDAPLAAALTLQFLANEEKPLSEIIAGRPGYTIVKRRLPVEGMPVQAALDALEEAAPPGVEIDLSDGIRLDWPDRSWVHARPSGTEPVFRVIVEAGDEAAANGRADWAGGVIGDLRESPPAETAAGAGGGG